MNEELARQRDYWNKSSRVFQSIYTRKKSKALVLLDRWFRRDMFERFVYTIEHCRPVEGKTYLDIGCGTGVFAIKLAQMGAKKVIAIDVSDQMIEIARNDALRNSVDRRCEFVMTDLLAFEPEDKVETSFGIGLFDYVKDPLPVLKKMHDLSAEKVIASFPRAGTWRMPIRKIRLALRKCPVYFYSKAKIKELMERAGFVRYRLDKVGKLYCVVGYKEPSA